MAPVTVLVLSEQVGLTHCIRVHWLTNGVKCECRNTQAGLTNVLGALYATTLFFSIINATVIQPVISAERAVSYRERAAGMYSVLPFTLALVSIIPVVPSEKTLCYCFVHQKKHYAAVLCNSTRPCMPLAFVTTGAQIPDALRLLPSTHLQLVSSLL